jgi:hypothetical protein
MTAVVAPPSAAPPPGPFGRLRRYLANHPILFLALLTPGIPEYLSGSSSPIGLLIAPPVFGLFLLANLGLYTAGVLLIREAKVRWHLGWPSVLVLGLAYGIAEEGLALDTLFNLHAGPVTPAAAGHLWGVNWIWSSTILPFHALWSVALPILFFELTFPAWRGRSLLNDRHLKITLGAYLATIMILGLALASAVYWMGFPVLVGSLLAIVGLILIARAMPQDLLRLPEGTGSRSPTGQFLLGLAYFPLLLLVPGILVYFHLPLLVLVALGPAITAGVFVTLLNGLGRSNVAPALVAFGAGALVPIVVFGFVYALRFPLGLPLVFGVDLLAILYVRWLYRRVGGEPDPRPAQAGSIPAVAS